jgi:hypothetical protein
MSLGLGGTAFAQTLEVPLVLSAKGNGFTITTNGKAVSYNAAQLPQSRIMLSANDLLQTGKGDFVQIAILGSDAILSVAENTNIMYTGSQKQDSLKLIYGRIRINTKGKRPIIVEGGNAAVVVSSGDSNIDYTILPGVQAAQRPVLRVSAIEGGVSGGIVVLPKPSDESYGKITVNTGETLLLDPVMKSTERVKLDKTINEYWDPYIITQNSSAKDGKALNAGMKNVRTADAAPPAPDPAATSAKGSARKKRDPSLGPDLAPFYENEHPANGDMELFMSDVRVTPFDYRQSTINLKTGGIIAGLLTMVVGVGMQSSMYYMKSGNLDPDLNKLIFGIGYVPIGIGAFTLLASFFYRTPNENLP